MEDSNLSEYKEIIDVISKTIYSKVKSREEVLNDFSIPVETSNHHIHLTRDSLDVLFGKGYELTKLRDLSLNRENLPATSRSILLVQI
jgi:putative phosphotransacetylase